jgi:transcriptional regulator with XRE-family HTH domain
VSGGGESELGRFLRARRAAIRPESVGLAERGQRRVPGLRRDELALLCGISIEYYVRLEQGRDQNPSKQVLDALATALRLDEEATVHLYRLARPVPSRRKATESAAAPALCRLIDSWPGTPAVVTGSLSTVLASNALARLLTPLHRPGTNLLRACFLDPERRTTHPDWDAETEDKAAMLRAAVGALGEEDPALNALVEELSAGSARFRDLWRRHEIKARARGVARFEPPRVGELELSYERFAVLGEPGPVPGTAGQYLVMFQAEPGSASALRLASLIEEAASTDAPAAER